MFIQGLGIAGEFKLSFPEANLVLHIFDVESC